MKNEFQLTFGERFISVSKTTWQNLVRYGPQTTFDEVLAAIRHVVAGGGYFMIENEDGTVHWRIDRMAEVEELVTDANKERNDAGQETFSESI